MERYIQSLVEMIKCNTVSKENQEVDKFLKFHKILEMRFPLIHQRLEKTNIDGNLIFKWKGRHNDISPIGLMNHMDTAEFNKDEWSQNPLDGIVDEEYIWGRGTIDTKGPLCEMLSACEDLLEKNFKPDRDIYFISTRNEEVRGSGGPKIVEYFKKNKIFFDLILDEGGAIMKEPLKGVKKPYGMIGVSEKGDLLIEVKGEETSLETLGNELNSNLKFKAHISEETVEMLKRFSKNMGFPMNILLGSMDYLKPFFKGVMGGMGKEAENIVKSTMKIKQEKEKIFINIKVSQEDGIDRVTEKLLEIIKKYEVEYVIKHKSKPTKTSMWTTRGFENISRAIKKSFDNVEVAPYRMMAGTEVRHFDSISNSCYRFAPLFMELEDMKMVHGIDEKIKIEDFKKGICFYKTFIEGYDKKVVH